MKNFLFIVFGLIVCFALVVGAVYVGSVFEEDQTTNHQISAPNMPVVIPVKPNGSEGQDEDEAIRHLKLK